MTREPLRTLLLPVAALAFAAAAQAFINGADIRGVVTAILGVLTRRGMCGWRSGSTRPRMSVMLEVIRVAANGRLEVRCRKCGRFFWLTARELRDWTVCANCVGWWSPPPGTPGF
jgi:hypothetical protein